MIMLSQTSVRGGFLCVRESHLFFSSYMLKYETFDLLAQQTVDETVKEILFLSLRHTPPHDRALNCSR